jgi:hypothetical protein
MNTKLIKSISQVILSLSEEERVMLDQELLLNQSEGSNPILASKTRDLDEWHNGMTSNNLHSEVLVNPMEINLFAKMSELSLAKVWDNSEDAVYDNL